MTRSQSHSRMTIEFELGAMACQSGFGKDHNPYGRKLQPMQWHDWDAGWDYQCSIEMEKNARGPKK